MIKQNLKERKKLKARGQIGKVGENRE